MMVPARTRRDRWLICLVLTLGTLAVYWPVRQFEFVSLDDYHYVFDNGHVQRGFTWAGLRWALTSTHSAHWHPLTWLSLMADATMHGRHAGGFHLTNLLLHTANVVLLFLVLRRLTGDRQSSVVSHQLSVGAEAKERSGVKFSPITGRRSLSPDPLWPSAWVAALFALHPLHVESVAWVTERKDVLSGLFWMLTLAAYGRYAASDQSSVVSEQLQKETGRGARHSRSTANRSLMPPRRRWYALTLLCFALGLLAKPMVVTLPFVLLLLDYWPLRRTPAESWPRLVREKIPFFLLLAGSCWITLAASWVTQASWDVVPFSHRFATAVVAYVTHLQKLIWPAKLACFYPLPAQWPVTTVIMSGLVMLGLTGLAVWVRRRTPAVLIGWCWYLGTLVPVIGLVQVGSQALADRYTYLPLVGVWIAVAWGVGEWTRDRRHASTFVTVGATLTVVASGLVTVRQLPVWRDTHSLFRHALAVTENNWLAHNSLGVALVKDGRTTEAIGHFAQAVRLKPDFANAHNSLGYALVETGQGAAAVRQFAEAVRLKPDFAEARINLGMALLQTGRATEALAQFEEVLRLTPDFPKARVGYGKTLLQLGRVTQAIQSLQETVRRQPDAADAHQGLGQALLTAGHVPDAIRAFVEALRVQPGLWSAHLDLGMAYLQSDRPVDALHHFEQVVRLQPDLPGAHNNLGMARQRLGRLTEAIQDFQQALRLRPDYSDAHYNLAIVLAALQRHPEAIDHLREVLRLNPADAEAGRRLGALLTKGDQPAEAAER